MTSPTNLVRHQRRRWVQTHPGRDALNAAPARHILNGHGQPTVHLHTGNLAAHGRAVNTALLETWLAHTLNTSRDGLVDYANPEVIA